MSFEMRDCFLRPALRTLALRISVCAGLLAGAGFSPNLLADQVPVLHTEGSIHGFLVIRTLDRKAIAAGDLIEVTKGDRIVSRLTFHFRDGSIDDERTVFLQRRTFSLLSDHHIQKGPSFQHPMDVSIDVPKGEVTVRTLDAGKQKTETTHMDLPKDLVNGMTLTIIKNISPKAPQTTVSYLTATPKPRIVKLVISPDGEDSFSVAGMRHKATRYVAKVDIGGLAGFVAPLIGKQPKDTDVWVTGGAVPAFVKSEGPLALNGPLWTIEIASPVWPHADTGQQKSK